GGASVPWRHRRSAPASAGQQKAPAVAGGGLRLRLGSAASDLEDRAPALRAGPLEGRLAVLHGDLLGVLDFDLHLVLHAVGFRHLGSSSGWTSVTGTFVPYQLRLCALVPWPTGTVASDPFPRPASGHRSPP